MPFLGFEFISRKPPRYSSLSFIEKIPNLPERSGVVVTFWVEKPLPSSITLIFIMLESFVIETVTFFAFECFTTFMSSSRMLLKSRTEVSLVRDFG